MNSGKKKNADLMEQIKIIDVLFNKLINQVDNGDIALPPIMVYHIFDNCRYDLLFNNYSDSGPINLYSHWLLVMSIEKNELKANICFNHLIKGN